LTEIRFVADGTDGLGAADSCDLDYKQADVEVSWEGAAPGKTFFSTTVAPENKVQEAQSCQSQPGGVLTVTVFDDGGSLVPSPEIKIIDLSTGAQIASAAPETGRYSFPLPPKLTGLKFQKRITAPRGPTVPTKLPFRKVLIRRYCKTAKRR